MTGDRGSLRGAERGDWSLVGPAPAAKRASRSRAAKGLMSGREMLSLLADG